jgi:hypothetical protein
VGNSLQDVRFGSVFSKPCCHLVAASLALGIGANTTVFTLVNAILLRPMPVRDIDRVVLRLRAK